tara:strand:+ start:499 stop:726 length:228 start_codon:yes stop_codon:yes gene_type:complete
MKIKQYVDTGNAELIFEEHEIKIINKQQKLILPAKAIKHFANNLMRLIAEIQKNLPEDIQKQTTYEDSKMEGEEK